MPSREATKHGLNFVFVANKAFALQEHLMKPYPMRALTRERRVFNYCPSRARQIVENAFGILGNSFRIIHTAINLNVKNINWVVLLACCALHHFLRRKATQKRTAGTAAVEDPDRPEEVAPFPTTGTALARQVREEYLVYFNGEGAVPWQEENM